MLGGLVRFTIFQFSTVFFLLLILPLSAFAEHEAVPGQYIIKYRPQVSAGDRMAMRSNLGAQPVRDLSLIDAQVLQAESGDIDHEYAKQLLASGAVDYIEPNYIVRTNATSNDPSMGQLWGLNSAGDNDVDAPEAWNIETGSEAVVVGVIDTGIDYNHPDLAANMWRNPNEIPGNGVDDDGNGVIDDVYGYNAYHNSGDPFDDNGHGTHCAGTIGAVGNNGVGVVGVNWNVKLMAIKFLSSGGSGSIDDAVDAVEYAIAMKNAGVNLKVLSNSWGGGGYSNALTEAISAARDEGILFVAAAGNNSSDNDTSPSYPASYEHDNIVSVAATDSDGNLASFSNYGANSVDVAAPGVSIYSTYPGNQYKHLSGTSMATPHVSGIAALVAAHEPGLSVNQLRSRVIGTFKYRASLNGLIRFPGIASADKALRNETTAIPPPIPGQSYNKQAAAFNFDADLGTKIVNADDAYVSVNLPFAFKYYENEYSRLIISTNGRILPADESEGAPSAPDYSNVLVEGIAPYHDDLYPANKFTSDSGVWVKASADKVSITWIAVPYGVRLSDDPQTMIRFQAVLHSSGLIDFHYDDTFTGYTGYDNAASATIGVAPREDADGNRLLVSHNTANPESAGSGKAMRLSNRKRARADFDGDGVSDIVVWRPETGMWYVLPSSANFDFNSHWSKQWGLNGDKPFVGDVDGDGLSDFMVYRPSWGLWYSLKSSSNYTEAMVVQWGLATDEPRPGDYDGDGKTDLAVYRREEGRMYILYSSGGFNREAALSSQGGSAASVIQVSGGDTRLLSGDFTGDGREEVINADSVQGYIFWTIRNAQGEYLSSSPWGYPSDGAVACDHDGDGATDRFVVRTMPQGHYEWFGVNALGTVYSYSHGSMFDQPTCDRDYDGDGKGDLTVFRPHTGDWFIRRSSDGQLEQHQFGLPGDQSL